MIISCYKVAHHCKMYTPCNVYNKTTIYAENDLSQYNLETYYQLGFEFPIPFQYDMWEVTTLTGAWLKRYYLIGFVNDSTVYPIYLNSYHIPNYTQPLNGNTSPETSLTLKGISAWLSFYNSKEINVLTPYVFKLKNLIKAYTDNWSMRDQLILDVLLSKTSVIQTYSNRFDFTAIHDTLTRIDEFTKYNRDAWNENYHCQIPNYIWDSLNYLFSTESQLEENDEYDVMLKNSKSLNIKYLRQHVYPIQLDPCVNNILEMSKLQLSMMYDNEFHPVFQECDILSKLAESILMDCGFYFKFTFDVENCIPLEHYTWNLQHHPDLTCRIEYMLKMQLNHFKDHDIKKVSFELNRGHLIIDITTYENVNIQNVYCLALHAMGPSCSILTE